MSLTENKKLFQIILGVAVIMIAVLVFSVFTVLRNDKNEQPVSPNTVVPPSKNITLTPSVSEIKKEIINNPLSNNKGDLMLYKTDNFYIEYITAPDVFFVKINKDPQKSKQEAQQWFLGRGLKQEDLCTISVRFVLANFEIRRESPDFSSLPDGCTGEPITKP